MVGKHVGQVRDAYDTVASRYAELLPDASFEAPVDLGMIAAFVDELTTDVAPRVLDAGCGTGRMIPFLRSLREPLTITGVDVSPGMLGQARPAHPDVEFVEAGLADLPFEEGQFDGVFAWYSIIHTPSTELTEVFAEFRRVLRPGGVVLVAFQAGTGQRHRSRVYGHDVELTNHRHQTQDIEAALVEFRFLAQAQLDRGPRAGEQDDQGFVLARRV